MDLPESSEFILTGEFYRSSCTFGRQREKRHSGEQADLAQLEPESAPEDIVIKCP